MSISFKTTILMCFLRLCHNTFSSCLLFYREHCRHLFGVWVTSSAIGTLDQFYRSCWKINKYSLVSKCVHTGIFTLFPFFRNKINLLILIIFACFFELKNCLSACVHQSEHAAYRHMRGTFQFYHTLCILIILDAASIRLNNDVHWTLIQNECDSFASPSIVSLNFDHMP